MLFTNEPEEVLTKIAIRHLIIAQEEADIEMAHIDADDILCALLVRLGYQDVVDEYRKVPKWYS